MTNVKIVSTYHIQKCECDAIRTRNGDQGDKFNLDSLGKVAILGSLCSGGKNGILLYMESDKDVKNDTNNNIP